MRLHENEQTAYDVVIVGGGPAGLSAAVALGRSLRSVLVVDAGSQRNLPAAGAHNVLGREGIAPAELVREGRAEAASYGADFADGTVRDATRNSEDSEDSEDRGFVLDLDDGRSVAARRILLATGLLDELPDIDGVSQAWGHGVLHCPFCHGYEVVGLRVGVIATNAPQATHQALLFARLADRTTVFANGVEFEDEQRTDLDAMGVAVVVGDVERVDVDGRDVRAVRVSGEPHAVDAVVVGPRMTARTDLYERLGGRPEDHPMGVMIPTDQFGATSVPGVWAAGNAGNLAAMVATAASEGVLAGAMLTADLLTEDVRTAREAASGR
ncbi:NAD(P)/FAD-dependent oxidoreductase [Gordonia sp. HY002]|uniref:NAD(P)/FAD-dependent oxidoreductase n=1 Tax=Gordonia zhenghanii TaxID=2911516 RepID=UPI001EF034F9|nr:NAD(P)/FAD-dependent oxidoreductase [Gordonia zhenghanii]MCF8569807.1 NAD(P)/FAD-dependent oxidoreductase [Gordonia zhenghanii]MCF8606706.1 NAD(P)/FAD-dependent oxidoreductase [Gordonia zhenghanii]